MTDAEVEQAARQLFEKRRGQGSWRFNRKAYIATISWAVSSLLGAGWWVVPPAHQAELKARLLGD